MLKITEVTEPSEPKMKYPKLMKGGTDAIYLMYEHGCGVRIQDFEGNPTDGEYCHHENLTMSCMTDYNQPITISNKGE